MTVIALDYGSKRIGVASSDPDEIVALPLDALKGGHHAEVIEEVRKLLVDRGARAVVLGLPRALSGAESDQTRRVRVFGQRLAESIPEVEVIYWDEWLSTVEAVRRSPDQCRGHVRDGRLDSTAAALVLQSYLDRQRGTTGYA
jgi:putative holliday junction resolvase